MKRFRIFITTRIAMAAGIVLSTLPPVFPQDGNRDRPPHTDSASIGRIFAAITKKGRIDDGIRQLERMRTSGLDNGTFLAMYARFVFKAFMPSRNDSIPLLIKDASQIQPTDTAFPCAFSWRIINSQQARMPFFEYRAGFTLRKPFKLVFPPLRSSCPGAAWLLYHDHQPLSAISIGLISQLSDPVDSAWFTIHIDLNDTRISPYEYIVKRISGIYDSIEVKNDLPQYHAISLRCYSRGLFIRPEGAFTAYVVFDRTIRDIIRSDSLSRGKPARRWKAGGNVRFTLTMRCGLGVQEQAEAKLQSMLRSF